jgi:hypothetical protein
MIFDVEYIVWHLSQYMALEPGRPHPDRYTGGRGAVRPLPLPARR